jgi:hypothetical protein
MQAIFAPSIATLQPGQAERFGLFLGGLAWRLPRFGLSRAFGSFLALRTYAGAKGAAFARVPNFLKLSCFSFGFGTATVRFGCPAFGRAADQAPAAVSGTPPTRRRQRVPHRSAAPVRPAFFVAFVGSYADPDRGGLSGPYPDRAAAVAWIELLRMIARTGLHQLDPPVPLYLIRAIARSSSGSFRSEALAGKLDNVAGAGRRK